MGSSISSKNTEPEVEDSEDIDNLTTEYLSLL